MSLITDITPQKLERVIDLVSATGIDVSDWKNFSGGKAREASNPKYCYEWAFVEPGEKVVLNLWLASMQTENGALSQEINMRERAVLPGPSGSRQIWALRAHKMDQAIRTAYDDGLPVRVIVCNGPRRNPYDPAAKASKVTKRSLDPVAWAVTRYNAESGQSKLTPGVAPFPFADQFEANPLVEGPVKKHSIVGEVFDRDANVRKKVLFRANGKCEFCGQEGFVMSTAEFIWKLTTSSRSPKTAQTPRLTSLRFAQIITGKRITAWTPRQSGSSCRNICRIYSAPQCIKINRQAASASFAS